MPETIEMTVQRECYPCFLRQAAIALSHVQVQEAEGHAVMKAVLADIAAADPLRSPAHASTPLHRRIRAMLGTDPFGALKSKYNEIALGMLPELRAMVRGSADPLRTAALMAIAGNIIDFGIYSTVDIGGTVQRALTEPLAVDDYAQFKDALASSDHVLYLLDNTGEVVFDMLLIAEIMALGKAVTAVVRGAPIINDCTRQDALQVGLTDLCEVIDNGTDAVGTIVELIDPGLLVRMQRPGTLVISKGQGNFETLYGWGSAGVQTYYLFQSKCEVVSRMLGLPKGSMLLARGPG